MPPSRLLGRTAELEILGRLIANVRRGRSAVLVVRGEPGIGKTELLRQLIAEVPGFGVARVAGVESEIGRPEFPAGWGRGRSRSVARSASRSGSPPAIARTGSWSPWRRSALWRRPPG